MKPLLAAALLAAILPSSLPAVGADLAPPASSDLRLAAPIKTWDEALPLGNGLLGGLLWGSGSSLRLSLDHGDLWDNRIHPRQNLGGTPQSRVGRDNTKGGSISNHLISLTLTI